MAGVTPFVLFALLLSKSANSVRFNIRIPHQDQIIEVTSLIVDLISSNSMYGGSFVRLFPFCKQTDPMFESFVRDMIHTKALTLVIGQQAYLYPLQTTMQKSVFNVMLVESYDSLTKDVIPKLQAQTTRTHLNIWRPEAPTFVVVIGIIHSVTKDVELIFEAFTSLNMYNTAIVFWPTEASGFQIVTLNPFLDPRLENKTATRTFQDIFYDKYANLKGSAFKITQFDHPIQSFVHNETYISGTDGMALALLCRKMNATYRVVGPNGPKDLYELYTGIDLHNGTADMNFNKRLFLSSNYLNSSSSPAYPHEVDNIVVLVPKAGRYPSYQNLLQLIEPTSRFVLMAVYLFVATFWFFFLQYYRHARPQVMDVLLDTLRIQLATSLPRKLVTIHERFLIGGFMVYGFIMISGYQTLLISFLASPHYQPDMQTLAELNRTTFVLYAPHSLNRLRGISLHIPLVNPVVETNITLIGLKSSRLLGTEFGYLTTNRAAGFFFTSSANVHNGRPFMHMIDEALLSAPATYRLKKNSPFEKGISMWISRIRAAGLYQKFYWDSFFEGNRRERLNVGEPIGSEVKSTNTGVEFSEIEPAFLLLGFGLAIASVAFVVEVFYYRLFKAAQRLLNWRMRACSHCGAPKLVKPSQSTEVGVETGTLPWVD